MAANSVQGLSFGSTGLLRLQQQWQYLLEEEAKQ